MVTDEFIVQTDQLNGRNSYSYGGISHSWTDEFWGAKIETRPWAPRINGIAGVSDTLVSGKKKQQQHVKKWNAGKGIFPKWVRCEGYQ